MKRSALPLLLLVLLASPAPALAQSNPSGAGAVPKRASLSESLSGAAKIDFALAQTLIKNGDFAAAFVKLGQAYDASKDPRLLFNMAICARDMHDYARMQTLLLRYKREGKGSIPADENAQVDAALAAMRDMVGAVRVTVSETGATVAVDGETVGTTPLDDRLPLNLGKHELTVSKPGFQPAARTVDIVGGSEIPLAITLLVQPNQSAHLVVVSDGMATVVVDGNQAAQGRFDGALPAGIHEVSVTEPGKVAHEEEVNLADGQTRTLLVTLDDQKAAAPWWPWVAGGAAVAAGLVVGGYVLSRPQGPGAAPLPTGTLGSIQLAAWRH